MLRPLIKWAGGKSHLTPFLQGLLPEKMNRYVEPFLGGGAVFLSLPHRGESLLNDANPELINFYRVVRDEAKPLMERLDLHAAAYSAEYFQQVRSSKPVDSLERAARFLFLNKTCFNGLYRENAKGEFNVPFGKKPRCPQIYDRENLLGVSERLASAELTCRDFEAVLTEVRAKDVVYCDPPYLPMSETACFDLYTKDGFGPDRHAALAGACVRAAKRGATILLSSSASEMSARLYPGWQIWRIDAKRSINCKPTKRGVVPELVARLDKHIASQLLPVAAAPVVPRPVEVVAAEAR